MKIFIFYSLRPVESRKSSTGLRSHMIKFIEKKLKEIRRQRLIRKYFEPDTNFINQTRFLFMEKLKSKPIKPSVVRVPTLLFRKTKPIKIALTVLLVIAAAGTVFYILKEFGIDDFLYVYRKFNEYIASRK